VASHAPIGLYALIGIVMLMGLVTKNAILLVEYCLVSIKLGVPRNKALVKAGEARLRPILMTTVAMVAGMVPIALGIGAGSEVRASMAAAVIGGLITSTLLTLVVVPVVFTYIDDFEHRFLKSKNPSRRDLYEAQADSAQVLRQLSKKWEIVRSITYSRKFYVVGCNSNLVSSSH
jgi:HAE1 family hydrophobic/amphiphilic exporter-1